MQVTKKEVLNLSILTLIALSLGSAVLIGALKDPRYPTSMSNVTPVYKNNSRQDKPAVPSKKTIDLEQLKGAKFSSCGVKEIFMGLSWWEAFTRKLGTIDFYSEEYIARQLRGNGEDSGYTSYDEFCSTRTNRETDICADGKDKKISINDDSEFKGCLSEDGNYFLAVLRGAYMGAGNYIMRYDAREDILEVATIISGGEDEYWAAPPMQFTAQTGTLMEMQGTGGDAGCGGTGKYMYDFIKNEVKLTSFCSQCEGEKQKCQTFSQVRNEQ